MYPTLSDLIQDLTGLYIPLPIQTFGFFLAVSFLLAAYTLGLELKRFTQLGTIPKNKIKEVIGRPASTMQLLSQFVIGFILGYKLLYIIFHYKEFVADTQGILLSMKGSIVGGLIGGGILAYLKYEESEKAKKNTPSISERDLEVNEMVSSFTMIAAIAGLFGAKLFHNLENLDELLQDPIDALLSFSGLTFFGGLIMGAAAVLYQAKKYGIKPLIMCDATAPGLMLSYGVGRIGCHMSGDGDWGIVNLRSMPESLHFLPDWLWSYSYPNNVINEGIPIPDCVGQHCMMLENPVWPTPLYEAIAAITLFIFLWSIRKKFNAPGILFGVYLIVTGIERFFIEKIRVNNKMEIAGFQFTQAELISVLLIFGGIALIYLIKRTTKHVNPKS